MQKIRLLVHGSVATDVLQTVQRSGLVEFTEVTDERLERHEPTEFEFNYVSARLDFAVDFLTQYAPAKSGIAAALEGSAERVSEERIGDVVGNFYATEIIDAAQNVQKELNDTSKHAKELGKERELLAPWHKVQLTVGQSHDTANTYTDFVMIGSQGSAGKNATKPHYALAESLDDAEVLYHIISVDRQRAIVTYEKDGRDAARDTLKEYGYDIVQLEQRRGTPAEEIDRIDRALVKADTKVEELEAKARELAKNLPELKIMADHTLWQKDRHMLYSRAQRTHSTLVYEGWCPMTHVTMLEKMIASETEFAAIERIAPEEGEVPPVEVENSGITKPFESVTRLYGLPGPTDLDPTPYLAGFFFIFFGFCLTDVGYGAVLMALTGLALWKYNVQKDTAILLKLLFLGGLSSAIAGVIFGGYFGIDAALLPEPLQKLQMFSPMQNPLPVFYLSLGLGVIQILFGLVVGIIAKAKQGQLMDGVLDKAPWILFFVGSGLAIAQMMQPSLGMPWAKYVLWAGMLALFVTQGRKESNVFMKAFKGVFSLYDVVAYFSDMLSYSRLLALGLATSALGFAVNMIASIVIGEDPTIFGIIAAVIILLIGHVFNLAVNTLGAFIHSARLQFVEFFGKFLSGTGRPFVPFRRNERHTTIE